MTTSGRDRDPGYHKKRKPAPSTSASSRKKPAAKPENSDSKEAEVPKAAAPVTPDPAPIPTPKTENKDALTSPVTEPQVKIKPALSTEEKKPKKEKPANSNNGGTSKKSKLVGVVVAVLFLVGISVLGYMVITSIMQQDAGTEQTMNSATGEVENEEGEAHAGAVEEEGTGSGSDSSEEGEELGSTETTDENSTENEIEEASPMTEVTAGSDESAEKSALSTVIRKKGEFEIPCWIVAYSANNKKRLANENYSALEALGYDAGIYWIPKYFPNGKPLYKVYVGPFKTAEEAQSIIPQISNLQPDAYIMKIDE